VLDVAAAARCVAAMVARDLVQTVLRERPQVVAPDTDNGRCRDGRRDLLRIGFQSFACPASAGNERRTVEQRSRVPPPHGAAFKQMDPRDLAHHARRHPAHFGMRI
jgi:hypothetical protein